MPTVITHPAVAASLVPFFRPAVPQKRWWFLGAAFTVVPDLDWIGFRYGIHYGDFLGHRGFTHSFVFAALLALAALPFASARRLPLFLYLFLCAASHGVMDAFTDGGLGVAFFAPFNKERFFFPWRPIVVSPIGISRFFNADSLAVLRSELVWVIGPSVMLFLLGSLMKVVRGPNNSFQGTRHVHLWLAALGAIVLARP
jgi:inner membrane protein